MLLEQLHHLREVDQRPAEAIDLVDDDTIDFAGLDVGEQLPDAGPLEVWAGVTAVAVLGGYQGPSLVALAEDVRLCRLPLGVEGVEVLI